MRHGKAVGWVALVCWALGARAAKAESVERGALSLDGALLVTEKLTLTPTDTASNIDSIDESNTRWGVLNGGFGFGAAYGVSDNVLIAAQLLLASQTFESKTEVDGTFAGTNTSSTDLSTIALTPRLEYVFANASSVRPFIAGLLDIRATKVSSGEAETSRSTYGFGGGFGLHAFVSPNFSIDPLLSLQIQSGSQDISGGDGVATQEMDLTGTLIALTVSLSGWFGDSPAEESDDPPPRPAWRAPAGEPSREAEDSSEAELAGLAPVKATQILPGNHAVTLKGRPEALPSSVMVRLAESPDSRLLQGCADVKLVIGNRFYRVQHLTFRGQRTIAAQARPVSDGLLPIQAIDALVSAETSHFDVCGVAWSLTAATRDAFRFFLGEFRQRGGTPPAPAPGPMPAREQTPPAAGASPVVPALPGAATPAHPPTGIAPAAPGSSPAPVAPASPGSSSAPTAPVAPGSSPPPVPPLRPATPAPPARSR